MKPLPLLPGLALISLVLIGLCGCGASQGGRADATTAVATPIPPTEVANALRTLSDQMQSQVNNAATALEQIAPGDGTRRQTLHWRIQAADLCMKARSRDNALAGLIELWYWTIVTQVHFSTGSGKELFAAHQGLVVERSQQLEATAEKMVRRAVPPDRFADLEKQIRAATADGDAFLAGDPEHANPLGTLLEVTRLEGLLNLGLSPFDAFGGIKAGGDAAEHMAVTAKRAVDLLADYPQLIDWHLQAALLELQGQDTVQALLAEVRRSNASVEAALALARTLPAQVRTEGIALLDQSRPAQADVRETLRALAEAATALERLNAGVDQLLGRFMPAPGAAGAPPAGAPAPAPADSAPARPFDIREYTAALNAATLTARDLRETVSATGQLLASPAIPARLAETDHTAQRLIALIAGWAIAVLITATACVVVGVRLLRR